MNKIYFMKNKNRKNWLKLKGKFLGAVILIVFTLELFFPRLMIADQATNVEKNSSSQITDELIIPKETPKKVVYVTVTAYSSTPDQTDNTPCITANGYNLCSANEENVVAANFLPFGTKVKMPEHFGDQEFYVQDRMNKRFSNRVDVWMKTREAAREFGIRKLKVEVY